MVEELYEHTVYPSCWELAGGGADWKAIRYCLVLLVWRIVLADQNRRPAPPPSHPTHNHQMAVEAEEEPCTEV
jgi:hypothetical protein